MRGFRDLSLPPKGNIVLMEALAKVIRANGDVDAGWSSPGA